MHLFDFDSYSIFKEQTKNGGADRDRTDDLRLAKPALSQLSYSPEDTLPISQTGGPGQT